MIFKKFRDIKKEMNFYAEEAYRSIALDFDEDVDLMHLGYRSFDVSYVMHEMMRLNKKYTAVDLLQTDREDPHQFILLTVNNDIYIIDPSWQKSVPRKTRKKVMIILKDDLKGFIFDNKIKNDLWSGAMKVKDDLSEQVYDSSFVL